MKNNNSNFSFVPATTYEDLVQNKGKILKENKGKSGIYMFKNLITGQVYIGSAQDISKRYSEYSRISSLKISSYMYISRALLKHGHENFSFSILEYCDKKDLMDWEGYYLNILFDADLPRYNISKDPTAPMAGRTHSPESQKKISDATAGRTHSDETRKQMSDARTGKQHSDETRKKMSAAKLGKPRAEKAGKPCQAIEVFDQDTKLTTQFDTISEAARALSINHSSIVKYFSNNQQKPFKGRYTFKKF